MDRFLTDVQTLRQRTSRHIDEGVVTSGYGADRETFLKLLTDSLETEVVNVLRDWRHHFMVKGSQLKSIAAEFPVRANQGQGHADQLAERIAIFSYRDIAQYLDVKVPATRLMLESILAVEEEHADELV